MAPQQQQGVAARQAGALQAHQMCATSATRVATGPGTAPMQEQQGVAAAMGAGQAVRMGAGVEGGEGVQRVCASSATSLGTGLGTAPTVGVREQEQQQQQQVVVVGVQVCATNATSQGTGLGIAPLLG
jgi:hypothetical protein